MNCSKALVLLFCMTITCAPLAQETVDTNIGSTLPPRVRGLLIQEMNAILDATLTILDALVRGQDEVVAQRAQAIHDSFVMEQEMTEADREVLLSAVPDAFVEQDRAFHELSSRLAEVARGGDVTQQQRVFAALLEACMVCHSQYAADRFPGFKDAE